MYAVIVSGGKQYRVAQGDRVKLEKLPNATDAAVEFDKVLMIADGDNVKIGAPFLSGSKVAGVVVSHGRGKKIRIVKMRRRKNSRRTTGHRQSYTEVKITSIAAA